MSVKWYADDKRAAVVDEFGRKWWLAPSPNGGYYALCDETGDVHTGFTAEVVLASVLGDRSSLFLAGAR